MAQTIITLCDPHLEDDDAREHGETWRVGIQAPGERWQWTEIDLCTMHTSDLATVQAMLAKYGRSDRQPTRAAGSGSGVKPSKQTSGPFQCSECDRSFAKQQGLSLHEVRVHGRPRAGQ